MGLNENFSETVAAMKPLKLRLEDMSGFTIQKLVRQVSLYKNWSGRFHYTKTGQAGFIIQNFPFVYITTP